MGLSDTKITSRLKKCLFKSLCSVSCLNNEVDNGQEENGHFTINKENNNVCAQSPMNIKCMLSSWSFPVLATKNATAIEKLE